MTHQSEHFWKSPNNIRVPDFMICGAMKSGTSTVHALLNRHPDVFIPNSEVNFFDMDDLFQHSDFFTYQGKWHWPNISNNPEVYWLWYQEFFNDACQDQLIGEDSTCYLPSVKAAKRIAMQEKPIKIIICLRDPVERAFSQYWHMLRTGRAMFTFEDTIQYTPDYVLRRSMYLEQVERFLRRLPRERIFFFVLEDFLLRKHEVVSDLLAFLGLNKNSFPEDAILTHANSGRFPKNVKLFALKNRLLRATGNAGYLGKMPFATADRKSLPRLARVVEKLHGKINPLRHDIKPKMNVETRDFLQSYFERELEGLSSLIEVDVDTLWFRKKN